MIDTDGLQKHLADVLRILDEAAVPTDLRPIAFECLWNSLSAGVSGAAAKSSAAIPLGDNQPLAKLADKLRLELNSLEDVYIPNDEGALMPSVPSSRLDHSMSVATRQLALLVCAGRQISFEPATSVDVIKQVCDDHGKLDAHNFNASLKSGDKNWIVGGKGKDRTLKLRTPGWEAVKELVQQMGSTA